MKQSQARILFLDIETAPEVAYIWKRWKETVGQSQIRCDGYVMAVCWAWGDEPTRGIGLYGARAWRAGRRNDDRDLIRATWHLLDRADVVVGHNVKSFDLGTLNARFVRHGLKPPQPYKIFDTLDAIKTRLRLPSNSLESASHYFGLSQAKHKQTFELWRGCLDGDRQAWRDMLAYCRGDVDVVRLLYKRIVAWAERGPNLGLYGDHATPACPACGGNSMQRRGAARTVTGVYPRYQCQACGKWARGRKMEPGCRDHVLQHAPN